MGTTMDLAVVLYHDSAAIRKAIDAEANPQAAAALAKYANLIRDVLVKLCGLKNFSHVSFLEKAESIEVEGSSSPFAIVMGTSTVSEDGELQGVQDTTHSLDVLGALTAARQLPALFTDKVGVDEEGVLGFSDEAMGKVANKLNTQVGLDTLYADTVSEAEDEAVADALSGLVPEDAQLMPLHPEDLLMLLPVFLHTVAGSPPRPKRVGGHGGMPGLGSLVGLVRGGVGAVAGAVGAVRVRSLSLRKAVWRLEDVAVGAAKLGVRLAVKAVRPALIAVVLHRTLSALGESRTLEARMSRMSCDEANDYYLRHVLGDNYEEVLQQDLLDAAREVEEGYNTDVYKAEKRLITAAMVRRLEVEDWDKERMKHFYYGSYGLGPWYFDMEERLRNPFFVGGRAWNGPIESWVGKNKIYPNDLPGDERASLALIEADKGRVLTDKQRARVMARVNPRRSVVHDLTRPGGLLEGVIDPAKLQPQVKAAS